MRKLSQARAAPRRESDRDTRGTLHVRVRPAPEWAPRIAGSHGEALGSGPRGGTSGTGGSSSWRHLRPRLPASPPPAASVGRAGASFPLRHPEAQPGASGVAVGLRASAPPAPACPHVRGSRGRHRDRLCAAPPTARPSGGKSAARAARALARLQTPRGFDGPDGPSARPAEARPGVPRAPGLTASRPGPRPWDPAAKVQTRSR